ncbi:MAG: VWA domain-containing protein [Clostridium perfringens]|nr:VWA domain-containing protein [Clostridium perfringens]
MNSKGITTKKLTSIISLIMTVVFLSILLPTNLIKAEENSHSMSVEKVLNSEMYNNFNNEILNNKSSINYTTDNNKGTWPEYWEYGNVSNKNKINKSVYGKNQPLEYNEGFLTKKAYTTDEDNVFDINLKIQGKKNQSLKKDVVFLLDNSNSMTTNNRAIKIKEQIKNVMDKLNTNNTRYALVTYASTILDGRYYHLIDRSIGDNQYTVYKGYTSNQCYLNFTSNIQEIYNKIPATVPNQRNKGYVGGTFTQEGLLKAIELLKNSDADEKIIIHLTDGLPTFSFLLKEFGGNEKAIFDYNTQYNGIGVRGFGTSYFFDTKTQKPYIYSREEVYSALNRSKNKYESIWNNGFPTTLEAENIKNDNPDINIYTIGVELKKEVYKWDDYRQYYNAEGTVELPEIRKFLESISSSPAEAFVNENVDDIDEIINKIIDKINKSINNGTVIDPMGDMVDIVKDGEFSDKDYKLTASNNKLLEGVKVGYNEKNRQIVLTGLNLGENEWVELNYKVRLNTSNPDFNGDFWYQANKRTVLNPNNKEPNVFRDFVIPSVTGKRPSIEVKLKKISSETSKPLANSEFELYNSINEKLNIKDIETTNILLPEIKTSEKVSVTKEDNLEDNTKTSQSMTLEIPRVSRTARRKKKKKKTLIKRMISYFKNSFSKIFLIKKKENKPSSSKIEYTDNFNKKEINIKSTNSNILEEVAIEKLPVNDEIETTSHGLNSESKLPFEIKIPKNFKGRRRIPKVDCDLDEMNFLNSNAYSLEDLKKDFRDLKLNSDFIKNINSDSLESNRDKSLEERVCNLEKKINELEEFFLEIFQAMSNK